MSPPRGPVLILDGQTTQALACARSLGRAGYGVLVASHRRHALGSWSRYCDASYRVRDETVDGLAAVRAWARGHGASAVLPLTERSCVLCNAEREAWERDGIAVGCGPSAMLAPAFDKARTLALAADHAIATPRTHVPVSIADARAAAADIGFPCIVKARFSSAWDGQVFHQAPDPAYATNVDEVERAVRVAARGGHWPLIQSIAPGRGKGAFALCVRGEPVAWFGHERLRDVRPSGGGSSLRRSVPLDARLREPAERLLRAMAWHGPAMVEFRDDGVNPPSLMEVNGRFWGSLQLAIAAGVDLPRLWIEVLFGHEIAPVGSYAEGVTVRWLWGDVKRFFTVVSGRPPGYTDRFPTRREGLAELFGRQPEGTRLEAWDPGDPWPALGEWVQGLGDLGSPATLRRGARRVVAPWRARLQGVGAGERGVVAPQPESVPGAPSQHV